MASKQITTQEQWDELAQADARLVVDPMVLRCGELFLTGAKRVNHRNTVWELLSRNVHAIAAFFDQLILKERIPVFNYEDTFDMQLNFDDHNVGACQRPRGDPGRHARGLRSVSRPQGRRA